MLLEEIKRNIEQVAKRKAQEYHNYHNNLELVYQRDKRRISNPKKKQVKIPEEWKHDQKHNPFYVLKHKDKIAKSIFKKIINGTYKPNKPFLKKLKKKNSSKKTRLIHVFEIPDEAISYHFYRRLLGKNKHRFSSFSYAYRNDRNVHYAIQDIALDIKNNPRMFIAEFDFRNFFGSIKHEYIYKQFDQNGFLISDFEKEIIKSFLEHFPDGGIPQGTSLSLFLANLVCWRLDKKLETKGLRFARYADDTVIWSESYQKICEAFEIMQEFSNNAEVEINFEKSEGISLLTKKGIPSEFDRFKNSINFLGYKLSSECISMNDAAIKKIKKHISYLLYKNLIQPLNQEELKAIRIPSNGEDPHFVTAIMQIRRYLYGRLSENILRNYLNGSYKKLNFKGLMSFYPLIDDEEQIKHLDKWLVSTILSTLRKRKQLLESRGFLVNNQFPFNLTNDNIILICKEKKIGKKSGLVEIPSFRRIYLAVKNNVLTKGIEETMHPKSNIYNY
ncbi:reverse transcriptase domain-containing protein [Bacillus altitudinis]|uniref:reverse transcriptase domain-containing protein n=1 Tax=Bacillus altitudinis TaxID=293387 RepID=UPI003CFA6500